MMSLIDPTTDLGQAVSEVGQMREAATSLDNEVAEIITQIRELERIARGKSEDAQLLRGQANQMEST